MFLVKMETGSTIIAVLLAALLQFIVKVKASDSKVAAPIVLDNATVELEFKNKTELSCSFLVEDETKLIVKWLRNGKEWGDFGVDFKTNTTTLKGITSTDDATNYTCVLRNFGDPNVSSKTFIVYRKNYMLYVYVLAAITAGSLIALLIEWTKRLNNIIRSLKEIRSLKKDDPVDSSLIKIDKNQSNWRFLACGAYGEVWLSIIEYSGQLKIVVLKTFKYVPFLNPNAAKLLFGDLKTEIQICQKLNHKANKGRGSQYIVRYEGFYAQSLLHLKVYLILEHCEPGQLDTFLRECFNEEVFFDDIDVENKIYLRDERHEQEQDIQEKILGMSHLMKWAEQIALAMEFIHKNNIVHRDLAARNILLKAPPFYETFDDIIVQLADFGMSRDLGDTPTYFMVDVELEGTRKPRLLPSLWYPPESIGSKAGYDKKSDVWSFGVLLWELFSLGCRTDIGFGVSVKTDDYVQIKEALNAGKRLQREYLRRIPDEIWLLIERCWDLEPAARPDFTDIYLELNRINTDFGLYGVNDTNQIADLGNNNNVDNNGGDSHPDASTLHQQQPEQNNINAFTTNVNSTMPVTSLMSHLHKHNLELDDKHLDSPKNTLPENSMFNPNMGVVSFIPNYMRHEHADES